MSSSVADVEMMSSSVADVEMTKTQHHRLAMAIASFVLELIYDNITHNIYILI